MGLLFTFLLGFFILFGAWISAKEQNIQVIEQISFSVGFGAMGALLVCELIPEVLESIGERYKATMIITVIIGLLFLKVLDTLIPEHDHAHSLDHHCSEGNLKHIGVVSVIALTLHNLIEGMAVYSVTQVAVASGLMMALGVGLHNIPMGMVIFSSIKHERRNIRWALLSIVSFSAFLGGIMTLLFQSFLNNYVIGVLLSLTMGMVLYIVLFELLPHLLHMKKKGVSVVGVLCGIVIIVISTKLG